MPLIADPFPPNDYLKEVYAQTQVFSPQECEQILATPGDEQPATIGNAGLEYPKIRRAQSRFIVDPAHHGWFMERLGSLAQHLNMRYFRFAIGYYSIPQVLTYGPQDHFDWHIDLGAGEMSTRKLSLICFLSEPADYTGGKLRIANGNKHLIPPQEQGSVVVFPSYLLHRVDPLTAGKRATLVVWLHGPAFS